MAMAAGGLNQVEDPSLAGLLVAFVAGDRGVRAGQREPALAVIPNRIVDHLPGRFLVAAFAAVPMRRRRKLPAVAVLVTLVAARESRMVMDAGAGTGVAPGAGYGCMLSPQRELRTRMLGCAETGGLPARLGMARRALPAAAMGKLALVTVPVAIEAPPVRQWRAKVLTLMACPACHLPVAPGQREFRPAVVKPARKPRPLPPCRAVANLAIPGKCPAVPVLVAGPAILVENEIPVLHRIAQSRDLAVALLARHALVQSRERVVRPFMREPGGGLPAFGRVAAGAFLSQLPAVRILVTSGAPRVEPQQSGGGILAFFQAPFFLRELLRVVALFAGQPGVFPFERPACLAVIEPVPRRLPTDQPVIPPVVLGVAPGAIVGCLGCRPPDYPGVIAPLLFQPAKDSGVAVQTAEPGFPRTELVTGGAPQWRVQILVRP